MVWSDQNFLDLYQKGIVNTLGFSANAVIKHDGSLITGAGAALAIKKAFPGVEDTLGLKLRPERWYPGIQKDYHLLIAEPTDSSPRIIAYQVKRHWVNEADLNLTIKSLHMLKQYIQEHPEITIAINCPTIGCGGLASQKETIFNMVEAILSDTDIIVCRL
jgi:hypothetical protein